MSQLNQDFLLPKVRYSVSDNTLNLNDNPYSRKSMRDSRVIEKTPNKKRQGRAPDGGWGWVVVIASMGISLVADGVSFSFGIIYIEFLRYFGASQSKTSIIGSLFMAVPLMSGPLASALVDHFGCRAMTILGGLISATGFVFSSIADSIVVLCFTFGILTGMGLALCYVTAVVSVTFWFDKKRSLAHGLGVCGTGLGTFLFAPLTHVLVEEYGWRGTILLLAGAFLQMCICGAMMREPDFGENVPIESTEEGETCNRLLTETTSSVQRNCCSASGRSTERLGSHLAVTISLRDLSVNNRIEISRYEGSSTELPQSKVENFSRSDSFGRLSIVDIGDDVVNVGEKLPTDHAIQALELTNFKTNLNDKEISLKNIGKETDPVSCVNQNSEPLSPIEQLQGLRFRRNSITFRSGILYSSRYRTSSCPNIFKSSLASLPQDKKEVWYKDFLQSMAEMMDFSMFLEWHFMLLSFSTFLLFTFFIVPYFYLVEHVIGLGYSESDASMLISIIGILNTIGMIALGWAGDQNWINVTKTYALCLCLCGIFTGIMPLLTQSYSLLAIASAMFGLFFASNYSFTPVLIVEIISLERFTMAYGLILFTQGLGNLLGPPLAGWLHDITHTWNLSFYLSGFFIFISGLAIALISCTKNFTIKIQNIMKRRSEGTNFHKNEILQKA